MAHFVYQGIAMRKKRVSDRGTPRNFSIPCFRLMCSVLLSFFLDSREHFLLQRVLKVLQIHSGSKTQFVSPTGDGWVPDFHHILAGRRADRRGQNRERCAALSAAVSGLKGYHHFSPPLYWVASGGSLAFSVSHLLSE